MLDKNTTANMLLRMQHDGCSYNVIRPFSIIKNIHQILVKWKI